MNNINKSYLQIGGTTLEANTDRNITMAPVSNYQN